MDFTKSKKIGILGDGSWATAIIKILQDNVEKINWHIRLEETLDSIKKYKRNPEYLSSVELDNDKLFLSNDINEIINKSDILIFVIPATFLKSTLGEYKYNLKNKLVVSAIKGIIPDENLTIAEFLNKYYEINYEAIGVIAGPCHAEEVAMERLSYLTIAFKNTKYAEFISSIFNSHFIKTNISDDIFGTQYSAVLKNIFAVASGICHGLGYGDNFIAVLISNAIQEIKRFVDAVHPISRDIKSSAYLGDLLVTAYSQFSRNRTFGNMIGKGYSVKSAQLEMNMIAEGYYAVKSIYEINKKYNVEMPITTAVYNILYEKISPTIEIKILSENLK